MEPAQEQEPVDTELLEPHTELQAALPALNQVPHTVKDQAAFPLQLEPKVTHQQAAIKEPLVPLVPLEPLELQVSADQELDHQDQTTPSKQRNIE